MKTLIIIDTQNDFMPGGSLEVPKGDEIVPVINKMLDKFDLILATQDWHPEDHASFASNHDGEEPFNTIEWKGHDQILWPDHCVQGSKGAEFHADLNTKPIEAIFRKGMDPEIDSYSGFYDNNHEKDTGLAGYLKRRDVKEIHFCGLAAEICVQYSILDALKEGFDVVLIEDATKALDEENLHKGKQKMREKGAGFVKSMDLS
jgi:nicotinamidase/pyrazinamidase